MTWLRSSLILSASLTLTAGGAAAVTCPPDAVPVGSVCVDKYEASAWDVPDPSGANAALVAKVQAGTATHADLVAAGATQVGCAFPPFLHAPFPASFPINGNWSAPVYAVSIPGVLPSACPSWFQAEQLCRLAGKRLLSNADWQAAAAGTPDPGADDDESTDCNVGGPPLGPTLTGSRSACVSNWGVYDMVGNVAEWVADWVPASTECPGWEEAFGTDDLMCLAGASESWGPGALVRGGSWSAASSPGVFAVRATPPPGHHGNRVALRCAR